MIIKKLLPEVATASRLNLRLIEARATLGSRVVSSSPLEWFLLQSSCFFRIMICCHGKHPLAQMPQSDPRDNSLSSCDCDPASRLQRALSLFPLERALSLFQAVKSQDVMMRDRPSSSRICSLSSQSSPSLCKIQLNNAITLQT